MCTEGEGRLTDGHATFFRPFGEHQLIRACTSRACVRSIYIYTIPFLAQFLWPRRVNCPSTTLIPPLTFLRIRAPGLMLLQRNPLLLLPPSLQYLRHLYSFFVSCFFISSFAPVVIITPLTKIKFLNALRHCLLILCAIIITNATVV